MALYAIGDLHLCLGAPKPMDIFGGAWVGYMDKLREGLSVIGPEDTTVLLGDLSWALDLQSAKADFAWIDEIPGKKIILKGNHDYWWMTMSKMNEFLEKKGFNTISFLHNNSFEAEGISICGTRGWIHPAWNGFTQSDRKYFLREAGRLEMSLKTAQSDNKYVFTHYPPMSSAGEGNEFTEVMKAYGVKKCYYGHLHSFSHSNRIPQIVDGIEYNLISADYLRFVPKLVR